MDAAACCESDIGIFKDWVVNPRVDASREEVDEFNTGGVVSVGNLKPEEKPQQ